MIEKTVSRIRPINEIGLGLSDNSKMKDVRFYVENGSVLLWVEIAINQEGETREVLQYLTPAEAMAFSKAFERCAIQAFKDRS